MLKLMLFIIGLPVVKLGYRTGICRSVVLFLILFAEIFAFMHIDCKLCFE